jgi:hypothetical protein
MPFDKTPLGGFKGNEMEYERYRGRKGSEVYWRLIENIVESLENRGFIRRHIHLRLCANNRRTDCHV